MTKPRLTAPRLVAPRSGSPRLRSIVRVAAALGVVVGAATLSAVGCNGTGVTPVCTYADGAIDPEAGCGTPVEASVRDALDDQSSPDNDAGTIEDTDAGNADDASDASQDAADASLLDAALHDAAIQDAHSDSKG